MKSYQDKLLERNRPYTCLSTYTNKNDYGQFKCNIHQIEFKGNFGRVLYGKSSCPECYKEKLTASNRQSGTKHQLTHEDFVQNLINKGQEFKVPMLVGKYVDTKTTIDIKCSCCNSVYSALPTNIYRNEHNQCSKCRNSNASANYASLARQQGLKEAITEIENNKKLVIVNKEEFINSYKNGNTKITVTCSEHNHTWTSTIRTVVNSKHCCPSYARTLSDQGIIKTLEETLADFKTVHSDEYDYSLVEYKHHKQKVKIICKEHGVFLQTPDSHLKGHGCKKCSASKEEKRISKFLEEIGVYNEYNYVLVPFSLIKRFDFMVNNAFLLEFDGPQHFKSMYGENKLKTQINNDNKANEYCKQNNIPLLRIPYVLDWEAQKTIILDWVEKHKDPILN